jgi:hypothetical protein
MSRKVMALKQIAAAYGVDYRTFRKDMNRHAGIWNELEAAHWDGSKFYPIHQGIIEKYFGKMPEKH